MASDETIKGLTEAFFPPATFTVTTGTGTLAEDLRDLESMSAHRALYERLRCGQEWGVSIEIARRVQEMQDRIDSESLIVEGRRHLRAIFDEDGAPRVDLVKAAQERDDRANMREVLREVLPEVVREAIVEQRRRPATGTKTERENMQIKFLEIASSAGMLVRNGGVRAAYSVMMKVRAERGCGRDEPRGWRFSSFEQSLRIRIWLDRQGIAELPPVLARST